MRRLLRLLLALSFASAAAGVEPKPNLVIFLADDLGWGDIGANGSDRVATPHIDRIAAEGIRFSHFYAPAAVCSPTRAGLLTGRNPFRLGIYTYVPNRSPMHLPRGEPTIASVLRASGYDTCFVGKWGVNGGLTDPTQAQPGDLGFDHWLATQNNAEGSHLNPGGFVRNGRPVGRIEGYSAQILVDEALQWLRARKDPARPFCFFVWFHEPHRVIATPERFAAPYRARFPGRAEARDESGATEGKLPTIADYLGNISHLDHQVGRVLTALDELRAAERTLVVFTSDNGPIAPGSSGGLKGGKTRLSEGGIRLPGVMRWPRRITPGQVSDVPVGSIDLLATACAMAELATPPTDGASLLPLFAGEPLVRATPLFWRNAAGEAALRDGDWKLVARAAKGGAAHEARDVAGAEPERIARMRAALVALHADTQRTAPRWPESALPRAKNRSAENN
ncbi:MAG: sulfatase-like hydrolase/transferase [Verrucomicrobia bacterium]|nr:sulfatase-like hydrolase/transferase [Verrucomicrobiota bacterium]